MNGYKVLLVDDAEDVHQVVGTYLELSGYTVEHAYNGEEGLRMMPEISPDLVLLDIQMPVLDGFGALQKMKINPDLEAIPVLFLSSMDRPNLKVKGLELGADDYLVKPCDRAELLARVNVAIRRSERYRRLARTMNGDLEKISLAELLQTLGLGGRSAVIELTDLGAKVAVSQSQFMWCEMGGYSGAEALERIVLLEHGRFAVDFDQEIEGEPIGSIQDLLLAALVVIDTLESVFDGNADLADSIELVDGTLPFEVKSSFFEVINPMVKDLLVAIDGSISDNAGLLAQAIKDGKVRIVE